MKWFGKTNKFDIMFDIRCESYYLKREMKFFGVSIFCDVYETRRMSPPSSSCYVYKTIRFFESVEEAESYAEELIVKESNDHFIKTIEVTLE